VLLEDFVNRYIRQLKRENILSPNTIGSYESDLTSFSRYTGPKKAIFEITAHDIERYFRNPAVTEKLSEKSIVRRVSAVRGFFNYLENEDYILRSPVKRIPFKTGIRGAPPVLMTASDVHQFFAVIQEERRLLRKQLRQRRDRGDSQSLVEFQMFCNSRNNLMFRFILETGIRPGELSRLFTDQVDLNDNVAIITPNTHAGRQLEITSRGTLKLLRGYLRAVKKSRYESPYLFFNKNMNRLSMVMIQKIFRSYLKKSGLKKPCTPTSLRHVYAVNLIKSNADMATLRTKLGYKTFEGLLIYHPYFTSHKRRKKTE